MLQNIIYLIFPEDDSNAGMSFTSLILTTRVLQFCKTQRPWFSEVISVSSSITKVNLIALLQLYNGPTKPLIQNLHVMQIRHRCTV